MKAQECIEIGFKPVPNFTVQSSLTYDLGRRRFLSVGCVGTPNEMLFICEFDLGSNQSVSDVICIHNWDHDGPLTKEKVQSIINALK